MERQLSIQEEPYCQKWFVGTGCLLVDCSPHQPRVVEHLLPGSDFEASFVVTAQGPSHSGYGAAAAFQSRMRQQSGSICRLRVDSDVVFRQLFCR